jgi:serine/threonine protein kinase
MASESPDSVTVARAAGTSTDKSGSSAADQVSSPPSPSAAQQSPLSTSDLPDHEIVGVASGDSQATEARPADVRAPDSRVVVIPSADGVHPSDVMPDEKTVISAAKQVAPPGEVMLPLGAKRAAQYLGETLIGRRLEHYDLIEFVGGGGMGAVFRAVDTRLGRHVAVKVLSRDQSSEENVRRFRNEAQSAARLDHRYIARVHYVGEDAGLNFIVFEFIEGINIRELVQEKGPLPVDEALRYTMEVAEALAHASQRDVVHRDIKPSNVLVTPEGHVKLVDMGLARLHQVDSSFDDLTASGVTLGTFDYISPEQARDPRVADVRSDIYSLGCTLYFMLVGKPPFPDGSAMQKLLNHSGEDPPDVRLFRPELPPVITPLLAKMLAKRPIQRQQSAPELVADIERIARDLGLEIVPAASDSYVSVAGNKQAWTGFAFSLVAPVVLLVAALIAIEFATRPAVDESRLQLRPTGLENLPVHSLERPSTELSPTPDEPPSEGEVATAESAATNSSDPAPLTTGEASGDSQAGSSRPRNPSDMPRSKVDMMPPVSTLVDQPLSVGPPPDSVASRTPTNPAASAEVNKSDPPSSIMPPPRPPAPKVVVRPGVATSEDGDVVGTLALALRRAADKGIGEIELDFTGELMEYQFDVPPGRTLVRPAPGCRPVIVFRPTLSSVSDSREMIHLLGPSSVLDLQELEIRLVLPQDPSFDWSLFTIHPGQQLQLSRCVLTIVDSGKSGVPIHENVSFVQLQSRRVTETMKMDDEMAMVTPANIQLNDCLVRGEANFLTVPDELPTRLDWRQGLFISNRRLVETGGAIAKPRLHGRMELSFDQLTISAQQGVFKMLRRADALYQLELEVKSNRTIFNVPSDVPLFEFAGMPSVDDIHLTLDGFDNCYPREDMIFLRARPTATGEGILDFSLANRGRFAAGERSPDLGVRWQSAPAAEILPHAQTAEHYRLAESSPHRDAGFRYDELPLPAASARDTSITEPLPGTGVPFDAPKVEAPRSTAPLRSNDLPMVIPVEGSKPKIEPRTSSILGDESTEGVPAAD